MLEPRQPYLACSVPMALARAAAQLRSAVLASVRIPSSPWAVTELGAPLSQQFLRGFAAEGTYLDKGEVTDRILNLVKNFDKVEPSKVTPDAAFQGDLGLDSLDAVELVMAMEEEFAIEIPDSEADKIVSCKDAIGYISSHPMAK